MKRFLDRLVSFFVCSLTLNFPLLTIIGLHWKTIIIEIRSFLASLAAKCHGAILASWPMCEFRHQPLTFEIGLFCKFMACSKNFFDDVKKELECSVCQEQFSDVREPKILKCLHTFCKTCLTEWLPRQEARRRIELPNVSTDYPMFCQRHQQASI